MARAVEEQETKVAARDDAVAIVAGNRLLPLVDGPARLEALVSLIESARRSLRLLYYTYADDAAGARVRDALVAALHRGVSIAMILDDFGSSDAGDAFLAPLREAGADLCRFMPRLGRRYLLRNHQKLALADEARAIIGGFNISDDYFGADAQAWRDLGLFVEGPAAARLAGYFDALAAWTRTPRAPIRLLRRALYRWSEPRGRVRWLLGGPARRLSPWVRTIKRDMRSARPFRIRWVGPVAAHVPFVTHGRSCPMVETKISKGVSMHSPENF